MADMSQPPVEFAGVLESAGRASGDVKLAVSLSENVPATLEALAAGEITTTYHLAQHSPVLRN